MQSGVGAGAQLIPTSHFPTLSGEQVRELQWLQLQHGSRNASDLAELLGCAAQALRDHMMFCGAADHSMHQHFGVRQGRWPGIVRSHRLLN